MEQETTPKAISESVLRMGGLEIPCAVLDNGQRILTQQGFLVALGRAPKAKGRQGSSSGVIPFLAAKNLQAFVGQELIEKTTPFKFIPLRGGEAFGFDATVFPDVCRVYTTAQAKGALTTSQEPIAENCRVMLQSLSNVAIYALIDEATGYQAVRASNALAAILESFIAKELQPWVQTFPAAFYENLFRLRGLDYSSDTPKRPQYFGVLTNDIIYKRLAPGVLEELKKATPKSKTSGRRTAKYFQSLTSNVGYPKLREHLGGVLAFMKISKTYADFKQLLDEHYPAYPERVDAQGTLFDLEPDTGRDF